MSAAPDLGGALGGALGAALGGPWPAIAPPVAAHEGRHVRLAVEGGVLLVTLRRPERKNPLTFDAYRELVALFRALAHDDAVRAVVLSGEGGNYCSGGDVHEIIGPLVAMAEAGDARGLLAFTRTTGDLVKAMRACPPPIVSAIEGVCAGAGAILAMASDLRVGTPEARIAFLFARVGLAGADMGACALLPRIVGQGRAADLLFTGRAMGGEEAERWGFLSRLVAPGAALAEATAMARAIAEGPAFAHAMTKRMLEAEWAMAVEPAIEAEAVAQALCMTTRDFARAYRAFAAKERPRFEGD